MTEDERRMMPGIAHRSLSIFFEEHREWRPDPEQFPPALREIRASFVTLTLEGELRGCIGSLQASLPLVNDIALHARAAAFDDPRFSRLSKEEFRACEIHVSALNVPSPFPVASRDDLLERLRPGRDGLTVSLANHGKQATFLPSVWEHLPEPRDFVTHLFRKAGLPGDFWDEALCFERYEVEEA